MLSADDVSQIAQIKPAWLFGFVVAIFFGYLSIAYVYIYRKIEAVEIDKLFFIKKGLPSGPLVRVPVFFASQHTLSDYRYFENQEVARISLVTHRRLGMVYGAMVVTILTFTILSLFRLIFFDFNFIYDDLTPQAILDFAVLVLGTACIMLFLYLRKAASKLSAEYKRMISFNDD